MHLFGKAIKNAGKSMSMLIIAFSLITHAYGTNPPTEGYGHSDCSGHDHDYVVPNKNVSISANLHAYIDSILDLDHVNAETLSAISFYKSIVGKDDDELEAISDSLFNLDQIPFAFLNEVNYQLGKQSSYGQASAAFNIPYDDSPYPANYFYKSWDSNRANPYGLELSKGDTSITLALTDSMNFCDYVFPVDGKAIVTSKFGWRNGRNHNGYDIDLEVWDPVKSSFAGVVRVAKTMGHFGRLVVVRHYNGLETYYAHLHKFKVEVGDVVEAGDVIGLGGSSGRSTGSHLHYEIRFKGIPLNPGKIVAFKERQLLADAIVLNKTKWSYGISSKDDAVSKKDDAFAKKDTSIGQKDVTFHQVKKGDYLYKIAKSYGQTIDGLCALNGIKRNSVLRVGQQLQVVRN